MAAMTTILLLLFLLLLLAVVVLLLVVVILVVVVEVAIGMLRRCQRTPHQRKHPISIPRPWPHHVGVGGEGSVITYAALTLTATSSEVVCMAIGQIWSSSLAGDAVEGKRVFHSD